jgi:hypothetical protein
MSHVLTDGWIMNTSKNCPVCFSNLTKKIQEYPNILRCLDCGHTFDEDLGIDDLSVADLDIEGLDTEDLGIYDL